MLAQAGVSVWTGGGLTPPRLDHDAVADRVGHDIPRWILDAMLDPYEAAMLAALSAKAGAGAKKTAPRTSESPDGG